MSDFCSFRSYVVNIKCFLFQIFYSRIQALVKPDVMLSAGETLVVPLTIRGIAGVKMAGA